MRTQLQSYPESFSRNSALDFIHLKDNIFAEYVFVYHINDGFSISEIGEINDKLQILFKKVKRKEQQLNLMFIDSSFPLLLADVVKESLINGVMSFQQYIDTNFNKPLVDILKDSDYLKYKFSSFIHHLLYTNISSKQLCNGEIKSDRVYYKKSEGDEIDYYSIYDQRKLQDLMLVEMKLEIVQDKTYIKGNEALVCLRIKY